MKFQRNKGNNSVVKVASSHSFTILFCFGVLCIKEVFPYLKIRVIETVDNVPSEREKLSPLDEKGMKETKREEKFLVFEVAITARESRIVDQLVETFHVCFQTLLVKKMKNHSLISLSLSLSLSYFGRLSGHFNPRL